MRTPSIPVPRAPPFATAGGQENRPFSFPQHQQRPQIQQPQVFNPNADSSFEQPQPVRQLAPVSVVPKEIFSKLSFLKVFSHVMSFLLFLIGYLGIFQVDFFSSLCNFERLFFFSFLFFSCPLDFSFSIWFLFVSCWSFLLYIWSIFDFFIFSLLNWYLLIIVFSSSTFSNRWFV